MVNTGGHIEFKKCEEHRVICLVRHPSLLDILNQTVNNRLQLGSTRSFFTLVPLTCGSMIIGARILDDSRYPLFASFEPNTPLKSWRISVRFSKETTNLIDVLRLENYSLLDRETKGLILLTKEEQNRRSIKFFNIQCFLSFKKLYKALVL